MRTLSKKEFRKRGCIDCLYIRKRGSRKKHSLDNKGPQRHGACVLERCPYRELDRFKNYREYLKEEGVLFLDT